MKIRSGFVSNSSSSSFICGIAEIKDKKKFNEYIEKHKILLDEYDRFVYKIGMEHYGVHVSQDKVTAENFETCATVDRAKSDSAEYFVVLISNDEGDGPFWNEQWGDYDYDIDMDYFDECDQNVYQMFFDPESGLNQENSVNYGAARNG